jgi:hypothetical protein
MGSIKELIYSPLTPDYYGQFLRPNPKLTLDQTRINLSVLCDDERNCLNTPTNGDSSLVIRYRDKEGAVLSLETHTTDLTVVQLQGAKSRVSYQVSTGFLWVNLFSDQINQITAHPQNFFDQISMPSLDQIDGLYDSGTDAAADRYRQLIKFLGLRYSQENLKYIRILK